MKKRNWRKINLSFTVVLNGRDGEDIRAPDQKEGNNDNKMKHHSIMSKIANFMVAVKKKCKTVKIMNSKKHMVLDSKVCMDSWFINCVNRNWIVQVILYIKYGLTATVWKMKNKVFDTLKCLSLSDRAHLLGATHF
jgi:hypothetical protein